MENYTQFLNRINSIKKLNFLIKDDSVITKESIFSKVNDQNKFRKFYGDTTVFDLNNNEKEKISDIIIQLYNNASECFCERRIIDTLHMTMHDLTSSNFKSEIEDEVKNNFVKLKSVLKETPILEQKIKMKTNFITNFEHVNLALVLCPINEDEYNKLMNIRSIIDKVKKLKYAFTPHVTLAYFNYNGFQVRELKKLLKIVEELNKKEDFEVELDTRKLIYQTFSDMNTYKNVYNLV